MAINVKWGRGKPPGGLEAGGANEVSEAGGECHALEGGAGGQGDLKIRNTAKVTALQVAVTERMRKEKRQKPRAQGG